MAFFCEWKVSTNYVSIEFGERFFLKKIGNNGDTYDYNQKRQLAIILRIIAIAMIIMAKKVIDYCNNSAPKIWMQ